MEGLIAKSKIRATGSSSPGSLVWSRKREGYRHSFADNITICERHSSRLCLITPLAIRLFFTILGQTLYQFRSMPLGVRNEIRLIDKILLDHLHWQVFIGFDRLFLITKIFDKHWFLSNPASNMRWDSLLREIRMGEFTTMFEWHYRQSIDFTSKVLRESRSCGRWSIYVGGSSSLQVISFNTGRSGSGNVSYVTILVFGARFFQHQSSTKHCML